MIILLRSEQGGVYWKNKRNHGRRVAASDLAAVLCMHPWKTRQKLFKEKKHPKGRRENKETAATLHGRFWEQYAIAKVVSYLPEEGGFRLLKPGSIIDWDSPIACSPDFMISMEDEEKDFLIGAEMKCPYSRPIPKKKEEIDSTYLLQCFSSLMTTCSDKWILAFYDTPTDSATAYEIYPDCDLWNTEILPRVEQFLSQVQDSADPTWTGVPPKEKGKKKKERKNPMRKGKKEIEEGEKIRERLLKVTFPLELSSLGSGPKDNPYQ